MTKWLRFLAPAIVATSVACGGSNSAETAAPAPAAPPAKKTPTETRADELIADLKRREADQAKIRTQPVVEVSPQGRAASRPASGFTPTSSASSAMPPGANENDANYWRQEFSMAQARLQSASSQLESARQRMNDAQSQASNSNQAVSRIGQDAYNRAQQEYYAAQSAVTDAQRAVENARYNALNAGVPASYLR